MTMSDPVTIASGLLEGLAIREFPLGARTTYRVGGSAALYIEVDSLEAVVMVSEVVAKSGVDVFVLGKGSNLLVGDDGFDGLVIALGEGLASFACSDSIVSAGAALALPVLARKTVSFALTGLEWAVGVPGSVGGAVRMNAGGHGSDIAASLIDIVTVRLGDSEAITRSAESLEFVYRGSGVRHDEVVVSARFKLRPGDQNASEAELAEIVRWRRENQPGGQNSGSVFMNPKGDSAGRLIDAAGLKGLAIGSAEVSVKHANFIQSSPGGKAADIAALISEIQRRVFASEGIWLRPELKTLALQLDAETDTGMGR